MHEFQIGRGPDPEATDIALQQRQGNGTPRRAVLSWCGRAIELCYPASLTYEIEVTFGVLGRVGGRADNCITLTAEPDDRFSLLIDQEPATSGFSRNDVPDVLMEEAIRLMVGPMKEALVLHAGAVASDDKGILIAGPTGAGKSSLVAWFVANGFDYLSDEVVALTDGETGIVGLPRALVAKKGADARIAEMAAFRDAPSISTGAATIIRPPQVTEGGSRRCGLLIFPRFEAGARLGIQSMSAAQAGLLLLECNLNARNLPDGGFAATAALARSVPAVSLIYGDFKQLDGVIDVVGKLLLDGMPNVQAARQLLSAFPNVASVAQRPEKPKYSVPAPTPRRLHKPLTIGMATYDDYDGVYFSLQALRLYHPEVLGDTEFVVLDNHPDGPCAEPLKALERYIPNYRYVPVRHRQGTAVRDILFEEAAGEFVLCMDCHVFIVRDGVKRLLDYFRANAHTSDLLQGPLLGDELDTFVGSHMRPEWRDGFYGTWAVDERARDPDEVPFDIPMQGLGLFACRRTAWPGFNPQFCGFGGEEGYIHEKFRRAGGRTLCLPFLRWIHRFTRPMGSPYPNIWEDRVRNYLIGFREVGLPTNEIVEHYRKHLGSEPADRLFERIESGLADA
jgi:Glycosyl transferase family 2